MAVLACVVRMVPSSRNLPHRFFSINGESRVAGVLGDCAQRPIDFNLARPVLGTVCTTGVSRIDCGTDFLRYLQESPIWICLLAGWRRVCLGDMGDVSLS